MQRRSFVAMALSALFISYGGPARGAEQSAATVVTIQGEMCGGCVKKMQGKLATVSGIASTAGNVAKKTMTIVPTGETVLSPKAIWEAIESAGKKPGKLVSPSGVFTAKPTF